ncbi:MAG TPA: phosphatase PAP2 family protein [Actinomycetota bacterium]|nr:phosphatase PAP2 family protein [Actinomycetota bacterium]
MERSAGRRWMVATAVALGAVFAALAVLVALDPPDPPLLAGIDRAWRDLALGAPRWAVTVSGWLKTLGAGIVMVPLRIVVAVWLLARRRYAEFGAWLLAWAVADLVTFALKPWIGRLRPDGGSATSFPSAHAKTAAQVAVGLALLVSASTRRRDLVWALAVAWIVAMAVSRTVLDEHWLSDVVAGSALGAACALGAVWVFAAVERRRTTG